MNHGFSNHQIDFWLPTGLGLLHWKRSADPMLDTPFWQSRNAKLCVSRCYKKNALSETAMQLGAMWDFRLVKETRQVEGLFVNSFAHNPSGDKPGRRLMETEPDMKLKTHASGERKTYLLIRCCWKKIWKIDLNMLNMLGGQGFSACSMLKQGTWTGSHRIQQPKVRMMRRRAILCPPNNGTTLRQESDMGILPKTDI